MALLIFGIVVVQSYGVGEYDTSDQVDSLSALDDEFDDQIPEQEEFLEDQHNGQDGYIADDESDYELSNQDEEEFLENQEEDGANGYAANEFDQESTSDKEESESDVENVYLNSLDSFLNSNFSEDAYIDSDDYIDDDRRHRNL